MVIFCFLGCSGITEGLLTDQFCTEVEALTTGLALLTLVFPLGLDMELLGVSFTGVVPFKCGVFYKEEQNSWITILDTEYTVVRALLILVLVTDKPELCRNTHNSVICVQANPFHTATLRWTMNTNNVFLKEFHFPESNFN